MIKNKYIHYICCDYAGFKCKYDSIVISNRYSHIKIRMIKLINIVELYSQRNSRVLNVS